MKTDKMPTKQGLIAHTAFKVRPLGDEYIRTIPLKCIKLKRQNLHKEVKDTSNL